MRLASSSHHAADDPGERLLGSIQKKTPAEKKAIREKNHARRTEYAAALAAAQAVVRAEAQLLRDKFGAHSLQWYMEAILQQPRITKGTRKVNRWNAFLQSEVKRINSGKCFI